MQIQIPENIDLTQPERYVLAIRIHPEQFSFSLCNPAERPSCFYHPLERNKQLSAFHAFREAYFDNEFFSLSYKKIYIINFSPVFTYVPSLIFERQEREVYLDFLFGEKTGKVLSHNLNKQGITVVHALPDEIYGFFQRSFAGGEIIHHTAPLITYFHPDKSSNKRNRMLVNLQSTEMDVFCFSSESFLLGNHFTCNSLTDAVYYILFIWKQLKFDQLNDSIHIEGESGYKKALMDSLNNYLQHIVTETAGEDIHIPGLPFEMACLPLHGR
ncbi:MAG: DUF3822 family protein [Candidatus Symbiothrix sp.]|jgi:hypothetical protein|nr:DUF3822 family protein [Candidatus Symbiothrix sp.]